MMLFFFLSKIIYFLLMILIIYGLIRLILFVIRTFFEALRDGEFAFNPWTSGCRFPKYLSESDFADIASAAAYSNRVSVYTQGPIVYGEVESQSGLSTWEFQLSFNDKRRITGAYYISSDNSDSSIPHNIGNTIKSEIRYRKRHKRRYMPKKY